MALSKKPEVYNKIKLLGEGSFGKAFLVECQSNKQLAVVKQMEISKMSAKEKEEVYKEAKILEAMKHPNIIKFLEVYTTVNGKLCIVMDYADGGDLSNKIKEAKGKYFNESHILDWFTQICLAIKHIHDRKVIHRDIKGQNVFLTKTGMVKLGDFGIAKVLSNTVDRAKTVVGTPYYMSPEIIEGKPYSFQSDVWSLGVLLYEMCALKPPFDAPGMNFLMMKIVKGSYSPLPAQYSKEIKHLVSQLLLSDPIKRPSVNQILKSPIIAAKIKGYLSETTYKLEFSHTILHKQSAFDKQGNPIKQGIIAPPNNPVDIKKVPQTARNKAPAPKQPEVAKVDKAIPTKLDLKQVDKPITHRVMDKQDSKQKEATPIAHNIEDRDKIKKIEKPHTPIGKDYVSERKCDLPDPKIVEDSKKERAKKIEMFMRQKAPVIVQRDNRAKTPITKNRSPNANINRSPSENNAKFQAKEKIENMRIKQSEERKKRDQQFKEKFSEEKKDAEKALWEEQRRKMKEDIKEKKKAARNTPPKEVVEWPGRYEYPICEPNPPQISKPKEKIAKEILEMGPADVNNLQEYKKQLEDIVNNKEIDETIEIEITNPSPCCVREDSVGEEAAKEIPVVKIEKVETSDDIQLYLKSLIGGKCNQCYEIFKAEYEKSEGVSSIECYTEKLKDLLSKEETMAYSGFFLALIYQDSQKNAIR